MSTSSRRVAQGRTARAERRLTRSPQVESLSRVEACPTTFLVSRVDDGKVIYFPPASRDRFGEIESTLEFFLKPEDRVAYLNANLAWARHISGFAKAFVGAPDRAVEQAMHAMRLSPQDPQHFAMQAVVALGHFFLGNYDEAYACGEAALRTRANFLFAAAVTAASAAMSDRSDEAAGGCGSQSESSG